jgi:hypothetical protein
MPNEHQSATCNVCSAAGVETSAASALLGCLLNQLVNNIDATPMNASVYSLRVFNSNGVDSPTAPRSTSNS